MQKKKEHVLAVDDTPANLQLLGQILKNDGYDVRMATNGQLALSSARMEPPDIILLDIKMPAMSGFDVCRQLKKDERTRDIPVIFISAVFEPLDKVKAFSLGGVDYITKPYNNDEVLARVRNHLDMRRLRTRLEKKNADLEDLNLRLRKEISERQRAEKELYKYQDKLRRLYSEMTMIEERERSEIATELHDNIGQQLALLKINLGAMKQTAYENGISEVYDEVCDLAQQAIQTTRSLLFEISPVMLYEIGFEPAISWLVDKFHDKYGIDIEFEKDDAPKPLRERSMYQLFRTTRELLLNVVKHSRAKNAWVGVHRQDDFIRISVEDDGVGFDVSQYKGNFIENQRFGLFSVQERMKDLGGKMDIESTPGDGTKVTFLAPFDL